MSDEVCFVVDVSSWARPAYEVAPPSDGPHGRNEIIRVLHAKTQRFFRYFKPEHMALVFDPWPVSTTWRRELWSEYKRGRKVPGEQYYFQLNDFRSLVDHHGVATFQSCVSTFGGAPAERTDDTLRMVTEDVRAPVFESDDIIASLVELNTEAGMSSIVVSADKDLWQLVRDGDPFVKVLLGANVDTPIQYVNENDVFRRLGVSPRQLADFMALVGDKDEAPGVMGIGDKTAAQLIQRYTTLEGVLSRGIVEERPALIKKLVAGRDNALLSKKLVTLRSDVPIFSRSERLTAKNVMDQLRVSWSSGDDGAIRESARWLGVAGTFAELV